MAAEPKRRAAAPQPFDDSKPRTSRRPLRWFVPVPARMAMDPGVSAVALRIATLLLHFEGDQGCFPSQKLLADTLNISKDSVQRYLLELEMYGFLTRQKQRGRRNEYTLVPLYEPPIPRGGIEETGELQAQNAPPRKPPAPRTLRKALPDPELPLHVAAPVRSLSDRRASGVAAPVRPVSDNRQRESSELAAPVRPPEQKGSAKQGALVRLVVSEAAAPVRPDIAAGVRPDDTADQPHPCGPIKNQHKKTHHQDHADDERSEQNGATELEHALAELQLARVNLTVADLGIHAGRSRALLPGELLAWARWVTSPLSDGVRNKQAFAATQIRGGFALADALPQRKTLPAPDDRQAEEDAIAERNAKADVILEGLLPVDRAAIREAATHDRAVVFARDHLQSSGLYERALRNAERRLVLDQRNHE